jgi:hypothetical protein
MSLLKKLLLSAGIVALPPMLQSCALPAPILEPLPESASSKDGKLTWRRTSLGYIVEGSYEGRFGRFEYIAYDKDQGPYVRATTKEEGIPIEGFDGDGRHLLDGRVNRIDASTLLGVLRFTCEDGKDPDQPQNGYSAAKLKEVMGRVNEHYHKFYQHIREQFDPALVRIAWETEPPWTRDAQDSSSKD